MMLLVLLFLLCGSYHVTCQTINDAKNLRTFIFTTNGYDYRIRPVDNQTDVINVYVAFYLLSLNELDEVTETMKTTGYLFITWNDQQLDWTPANYGGITYTFWPQNEIWKPDVALKNSYTQYKTLGDSSLNVYNYYDGSIQWQPFQVFQSTCSVQITYFPFDTQECKMEFVAWSYYKTEVMMQGDTNRGIDLYFYEPNPSWEILDTSWSQDTTSSESSITFTIKLKRKPLYVMLSIVLPIMLLSLLNIFTFVLPSHGGEKAGYAVTIFLAFAVFLTIVTTTLPENSESVALFSIYVILMTSMSTLITIIALIECRFVLMDVKETPIPGWLKTLALAGKCLRCKTCRAGAGSRRPGSSSNKVRDIHLQGNDPEKVKHHVQEEDEPNEEKEDTWVTMIDAFDTFCFIAFSIFAVLANFLFLVIAGSS